MKTAMRSATPAPWTCLVPLAVAGLLGSTALAQGPSSAPAATPGAPPSAASAAAAPPAASRPAGQTIYRITLPDGRVILTDRPPEKTPGKPSNAKVETIQKAPPPSPEATAAAQQRLQSDKASNDEARRQRQAQATADAQRESRIAVAQQRLLDAEARAQAAATPREGDFTAVAGGGTRLNDTFYARQAAAAADVAAARAALDAALRP